MALGQDILTRIVNVQWAGKRRGFLYSGEDGMYGSRDGEDWTKANNAVAARSLAWIDDIWIGCNPDKSVWRSEDGAKTWATVAVPRVFEEVAAFRPKGKQKQGIFAGWCWDEAGEHNDVYTSHDLGKTWGKIYSIATTVVAGGGGPDNGYEFIQNLSGCGERLFICTQRNEGTDWQDQGNIYSSSDGLGASGGMVFGPPSFNPIGPFSESKAFSACAVAFDDHTEVYAAIGFRQGGVSIDEVNTHLIHTTSATGSFGSTDGTIDNTATVISNTGDGLSTGLSAAGGNGVFAACTVLTHHSATSGITGGETRAHFIPPGSPATLQPIAMTPGPSWFVGSFCFNSKGAEMATDGTTQGVFACVAFGVAREGGVYVAKPSGSWRKTHSGTAFGDDHGIKGGAVAVGRIGFLESETA